MKAPTQVSDHAVRRYIERWGPPMGQLVETLDYRKMFLTSLLDAARHVEDVLDENQSIWAIKFDSGEALIVVDAEGVVRTVLPPGAKRPPARGHGRWR